MPELHRLSRRRWSAFRNPGAKTERAVGELGLRAKAEGSGG